MEISATFTHKGWFGFCPVYLAGVESGEPMIHERHKLLLPVMILSEGFFGAFFFARSLLQPSYEPQWPIWITGELNPPKTVVMGK